MSSGKLNLLELTLTYFTSITRQLHAETKKGFQIFSESL